MSGSKELDAYAVLGVDPAADDESVAAAYRALARRLHPDVAGDGATHQMSVVNAAFRPHSLPLVAPIPDVTASSKRARGLAATPSGSERPGWVR